MHHPVPCAALRGKPHRSSSRGFMLIEVLVGLLIFSLGILGLVGLQAAMTQSQTAAKVRADAAFLASELIGSMWSDMPNLANYAPDKCAGYAPCNDWMTKVASALPGGKFSTASSVDSTTGDVTIILQWTLPNGGGTNSYTTSTTVQAAI